MGSSHARTVFVFPRTGLLTAILTTWSRPPADDVVVEQTAAGTLLRALAQLAKDFPEIAEDSLLPEVGDLAAQFVHNPLNEPLVELLDACFAFERNVSLAVAGVSDKKNLFSKTLVAVLDDSDTSIQAEPASYWRAVLRVARAVLIHEGPDDAYFVRRHVSCPFVSVSERKQMEQSAQEQSVSPRGGGTASSAVALPSPSISSPATSPLTKSSKRSALSAFKRAQMHVKLLEKFRQTGDFPDEADLENSLTKQEILDTLLTLMRKDVTLLKALVGAGIVKDVCDMIAASEEQPIANPWLLAAGCRCLALLLKHGPTRQKHIKDISTQLNGLAPTLLAYLAGDKYRKLVGRVAEIQGRGLFRQTFTTSRRPQQEYLYPVSSTEQLSPRVIIRPQTAT